MAPIPASDAQDDDDADYQHLLGDLDATQALVNRLAGQPSGKPRLRPYQPRARAAARRPKAPTPLSSDGGSDRAFSEGDGEVEEEGQDREEDDEAATDDLDGGGLLQDEGETVSPSADEGQQGSSADDDASDDLDDFLDQYVSLQSSLGILGPASTPGRPLGSDKGHGADGNSGDEGGEAAAGRAGPSHLPLVPPSTNGDTSHTAVDAADAEGGDWFVELPPGAPLPQGRLGALYAALLANRRLAGHLRHVVMAKVERMIDANWGHTVAVRAVPEAVAALLRARPKGGIQAYLNDPLRRAAGPSGQQRPVGASRYWIIDGEVPELNEDTKELAQSLHGLPSSYERTRWPARLIRLLTQGVQAEVHAHLTEEALKEAQAALQPQGEGGSGVGGMGLPDLTQRFAEIQAIQAQSAEGHRISAGFSDEQWQRIATAHVKDRSAVDCKVFWLHSLRKQPGWTDEEREALQILVQELGMQQWEEVARRLGSGRTPAQCLQAYLKDSRPQEYVTRGRMIWTAEDTTRLEQFVAKMGTNWVAISAAFGGKYDRHQLRDRWHGQAKLRGTRRVGKWRKDEDDRLLKAVEEVGTKWRLLSAQVGTRTAQQCRERYENVLRADLVFGPWSREELEELREGIEEVRKKYGRIMWTKVAARLRHRTDDMCKRAWAQLSSGALIIKGSGAASSEGGEEAAGTEEGQAEGELDQLLKGGKRGRKTRYFQARHNGRGGRASLGGGGEAGGDTDANAGTRTVAVTRQGSVGAQGKAKRKGVGEGGAQAAKRARQNPGSDDGSDVPDPEVEARAASGSAQAQGAQAGAPGLCTRRPMRQAAVAARTRVATFTAAVQAPDTSTSESETCTASQSSASTDSGGPAGKAKRKAEQEQEGMPGKQPEPTAAASIDQAMVGQQGE